MTTASLRRLARAAAACAIVLVSALVLTVAPRVEAQDRTEYMIRLLRTSDSFRVRAQAALSLGRVDTTPEVVRALSQALGDEHPSVRTAAAASLERLGDPSALGALRNRRSDRDSTVRNAIESAIRALERVARTQPRSTDGTSTSGSRGPARYYIGVGMPGAQAAVDRTVLDRARELISSRLRDMDGVVIAPDDESTAAARRVLSQRSLTGYYLDSSIVSVEATGDGTRAVVSMTIQTYPGRDMRAILRGAATVPGASGRVAEQQAIDGAIRGAMRSLPQAMAASGR